MVEKAYKYKVEKVSGGTPEYAIRYTEDREEEYAKVRGGDEFRTDFDENNMGYEVYLSGNEISKEEYDEF